MITVNEIKLVNLRIHSPDIPASTISILIELFLSYTGMIHALMHQQNTCIIIKTTNQKY